MAIIVPYALGKMSVSNDELLLFIGLAIGISKIVVGTLATRYKEYNNKKVSKDELRDICKRNLEVLKNVNEIKEIEKYTEEINMILSRLDNE